VAPAGGWAAAVRAKAVLVEAARVLPEMTTKLRSVTGHNYPTQERSATLPRGLRPLIVPLEVRLPDT